MKAAAAVLLRMMCIAGAGVFAVLIFSLAMPGHVVASWISPEPQIQATGIGECNKAARLYRINPDTVIPPGCVGRGGFKGLLPPPGDNPPPPDDAGDVPPPPQP
jgi:hypothetical protein